MTDSTGADTPQSAGSDWSAQIAKLGPGEKFAVLGAAGVAAVWVIFDLIIDEYGIDTLSMVVAIAVVLAAYRHHNGGSEGWSIPYRTIVFAGAAVLGFVGLTWIIEELRGGIFDADATTVIGALAYYASAVVAGIGAWQLKGR